MKKLILTTLILILITAVSFGQSKSEETSMIFGVRGNCGMCKGTIEKVANSIDGVSSAVWDKKSKKIEISYNASKTNILEIHNAIVASGYDTDLSTASEKAYNKLAGCCQYDREMKMNTSKNKKDNQNSHKH